MTQSLRPSPRILLSGLIGGAATASGIALTATSGWLIVRASERPVILTLLVAVVGVRAFGIARPALRYLERIVSHDAALADLATRRADLYASLVPLTPARLGRRSRSTLLAGVVDDVSDVVDSQVRVTVPVLSAVVAGVIGAVLAALLAPTVGLIVVGLLLAVAAASYGAYLLEKRSQTELLAARARVQQVSDIVTRTGVELQAIGAEDTARRWLAEAQETWQQAVTRQARGRSLVAAAILVATGIATAAAAAVALGVESRPVAALLDQVPAVAGAGQRIPHAEPEVSTERVQASWTGEHPDMPPVTLGIEPGASVALIGPNGAGKSTLLAVLARHLDPTQGRYALTGDDVTGLDLAETRAKFAIVDDEPHVFASTVRENLRLAAPDAGDKEILAALQTAGLADLIASMPQGLDTHLGAGARGLSGGERARVAIGRAALSQRPLVLLDEPVAHLDHATAVAVLRDLRAATDGRTVVMVSHRADGLDDADAVIEVSHRRPISTTVCRKGCVGDRSTETEAKER